MFAVIETGGKQYLVSKNQKLRVEKLASEEGGKIVFDKILLLADEKTIEVGKPYLSKARVEAVVVGEGRSPKIRIMRYHSKTRHRRRKGHRQPFTEIEITSIAK